MFSSVIAVDLGSYYIRINLMGKGIVIKEPSIMAVNRKTKEVIAIGREAYNMIGRTSENVEFHRPFKRGVVTDFTMAEYMLTTHIKKIVSGKLMLPSAMVAIPTDITDVQKHAISDVFERSGIRKINYIDDTIATVKGSGMNLKSSTGIMVINIGYSHTTSAVLAGGKVISEQKVLVGGHNFNEALINYVRKKNYLSIGELMAEQTKREIGSVVARDKLTSWHVIGQDINTGMPKDMIVTSDEVLEAFLDPMNRIYASVQKALDFVPEEILGDIRRDQIILTGGGAKLYGVDRFLQRKLGLPVLLSTNADNAVIVGAAQKY